MLSKRKQIFVLVADDEAVLRNLFTDLLTDRGYQVIAVENGRQAVEQAKQVDFAIGFMDMHMPVMNGVEALIAIKLVRPRMKMVMMDSYPDALVEQARKEGALSCIQKPFEISQIIEIMEQFVEQVELS